MSQNQKIGLIVVGVALVFSLAITVYINMKKNELAAAKAQVESQLEQSKMDGAKKAQEIQGLNDKIQQIVDEKTQVEKQLQDVQQNVKNLSAELKKIGEEKDKWQQRAEESKKEQDTLNARITELNKRVEDYKAQEQARAQEEVETPGSSKTVQPKSSVFDDSIVSSGDEQWAGVLKAKAGLEVDLDHLKEELSKASQELIDVRQRNEELQVSLDGLTEQKASVDREIKYKTDLVNNLSLDLARAKNDQRVKEERIRELDVENMELRKRIKDLVAANGSLEKSMVRLNQDKRTVEKRLDTTEDLIHSRINEIWDIKSSIDQTMSTHQGGSARDVELPPIMVSNQRAGSGQTEQVGYNGTIANVNGENNFVILNIGQRDGLAVGDSLGVYRDSRSIGRLEVIQVRDDIAAADIKDQSVPLQAGDTVR